MKSFLQKLIGTVVLMAFTGVAQAVPFTITFTADNIVDLQINCIVGDCASGSVSSGGVGPNANNWTLTDTTVVDLAPGDYFAIFGALDLAQHANDVAGFLAEMTDGTTTWLSDTSWEVTTDRLGTAANWTAATQYGTGPTAAPWNCCGGVNYSGAANWIWTDDRAGDDAIYIRKGFTVAAPVPEPSVIALFTAGLFGLGFARRRKA